MPEVGGAQIDGEGAQQRCRVHAAAAAQQFVKFRHEARAFGAVALVEGQGQQLAEDIGVAVETAVDEVADIAPAPAIGGNHRDAVAEEFVVFLPPQLAIVLRRQQPLAAPLVGGEFEAGQQTLAKGGGDDLFEAGTEEADAHLGVLLKRQKMAGQQHLGEDTGGFGKGEGRMVVEEVVALRQEVMDTMADLVGQGRDIAARPAEVEEDIGITARIHAVAERPRTLARARVGIDAPRGEKGGRPLRQLRRETGKCRQHLLLRLGKRDAPRLQVQRRVEIGIFQALQAEELALKLEELAR